MDFLFLDFETLSQRASEAPIISMGAICGTWDKEYSIDELRESGFYRDISIRNQLEMGLKIQDSTLKWWNNQNSIARKVLFSKMKIPVNQCFLEFNEWCKDSGIDHKRTTIWIRAPHYDFTIYQNIIHKLGLTQYIPLVHWNVRDVRTAIDLIYNVNSGYKPGFKTEIKDLGLIEHNSLDDCIKDYLQIKDWYIK